jgi:hypothetical protein
MDSSRKKYIFVLCPPYQGSTVIYRLLGTSPNVSTFLGKAPWMGEGFGWINHADNRFAPNRWDPNYPLDMKLVHDIYHNNWDTNKPVLCEKSPAMICRASLFYDWFKQYGDVYFIIQMRDPYTTNYGKIHKSMHPPSSSENSSLSVDEYSYKLWDEFALYQKDNLEKFRDISVFVSYEELCDNTDGAISKILEKMPFLGSLNPKDKLFDQSNTERFGRIQKVDSITDKEEKTRYFKENSTLLKYFNYKIT